MGVRGLWEVVAPVARPVKLEALASKRLAIDASIWIYQFLKAMRDGEGNVLRHAHIVGFFRRICKLLFFGIKPVFVFDGGAPALKKNTIMQRQQRRQFKEESAAKTATRLLAMRLHKQVAARKEGTSKKEKPATPDIDTTSGEVAYLDEVALPKNQRHSVVRADGGKRLTKYDQYSLPEVDQEELSKLMERNDPRLMTAEELDEYAEEFQTEMSGGLYDTSKIDFNSEDFKSLPITTQYQLLNTARLRSRLRMGYTKEQLEQLFPDKLEFSKFQINRVAQRNFLTQKVMNVVGMDDGTSGKSRRIAGSKDSEYMLQKNANGWTLALQNNEDGVVKIDVDETQVRRGDTKQLAQVDEDSDDDDDWETVPIENEKTKKESPELPEALQGFESQVLRNQLYDKLKQKAEGNKPKSSFFVFDEEPSNAHEAEASEKSKEQKSVLDFSDDDFDKDNFGSSIFSKNKPDDENKITDENDKKDTEKKKVEVLPPWFIKDRSKANNSEMKTSHDEQFLDDDELVPFDQLHREENLPVYVSESENEGEKLNPVIINDSSDDSDLEEVEINPKTGSNIMVNTTATSDLPEPVAEDLKILDSNDITDSTIKRHSPSNQLKRSAVDDVESNEKSNDTRSPITEISEPIPPVLDIPEESTPSLLQEKSVDPIPPKYSEEHENELAEEDFKFAQQEEEELLERIEQENEENERFAQELNLENQMRTSEEFDLEINTLKEQARKDQRDSDEVTQAMVDEVQELLRRFGIPYITAPMEAEAQCAMLMELSLVDGIVTDDSDCFLFGGKRIFKNMFSQNKYVECYDATDLEREFGLDRSKYINLALLLGSDYTDGVTGIGPVTAMEILAEFDGGDSLAKFKEWWEKVQLTTGQRSDEVVTEFKRKFKKSSATKIFLPDKFPDPDVREAYLHPEVDSDATPFEWGTPDLDSIRTFMKQMVGWKEDRTDQVLVPVIKDMNRKIQEAKQSTINDFFLKVPTATKHTGSAKSSRMKRAMERLGEKHKTQGTKKRALDGNSSGADNAGNSKHRKITEN